MATQFTEAENPRWRRTFFPIWIGQAFSLIGSRLVGFALIWYLTESTEKAIYLTMATLVGMLPEMVLAPFAGALADRWNRQKVMILADGLIAAVTLVLSGLFAFGWIQLWHIYALMFIRSIGGAFHYPAMSASTSLMVPKEKFTKIQGLNQLLQGALAIAAPPLGALAIDFLEMGQVLFIDVATAMVAILPLFIVKIPQPNVVTTQEQRDNPMKTMWGDLKEGLQYVYAWKGLFYVMLLATGINAILNPAFSLLSLLVYRDFGLGADKFALIEMVLGIGLILGSVILSVWGGFKKKVFTSATGLMAGTIGLLLMAFAPTSAYWMLLVGIGVFGLTNAITNGPLNAVFQEAVEPQMQGRVFSLIGTMAMAASPIGMIAAGPVADWLGVQAWFVVGSIYIVFMCSVMLASPAIRNLEEGNPNRAKHAEEDNTMTNLETAAIAGD